MHLVQSPSSRLSDPAWGRILHRRDPGKVRQFSRPWPTLEGLRAKGTAPAWMSLTVAKAHLQY